MKQSVWLWLIIGLVGFFFLPWYAQEEGFWRFIWVSNLFGLEDSAVPAVLHGAFYHRYWLLFLLLPLLAPLIFLINTNTFHINHANNSAATMSPTVAERDFISTILIVSGAVGLFYIIAQGFIYDGFGWAYEFLDDWFGVADGQPGLGYGGLLVIAAFLFYLTTGFAVRGFIRGDAFITGSLGLVIALVLVFVFFPVLSILNKAFQNSDTGLYAVPLFFDRLFSPNLWSLSCLYSDGFCGSAWTTFWLAILTGASTTILGLAFALIVTRTGFRAKKLIRLITVLPIITPPFVISLALVLLLESSGTITVFLSDLFDAELGSWLYGLPGIWLAQTLSYTPIAFLVMIGVVEGISPSMEEASETLNASRWKTFTTVTFPLMRTGIANAFLIGFIESMADLGNPIILGGDYPVLSTEIYFAVAGATVDTGKAASLAIVLLFFTLSACLIPNKWIGKKSYATITGKGDTGIHAKLPKRVYFASLFFVLVWGGFTLVVYSMVLLGGFFVNWGIDNSFTLQHYVDSFGITFADSGVILNGFAWDSFTDTMVLAVLAAPLTALVGMLIGYLLSRQNFSGKSIFEFGTMLSFAIPGIVIGIAYVIAFNQPPIELTFTGIIIILSFMFRNMPVGIRASVAAMAQLDKNMDEAALTLGASRLTYIRTVIIPLLRPAIIAALIYSFIRAITSISAVIFLVSAEYNLATTYIIGLVEGAEYGPAIAYSSVLIVVMILAILFIQLVVGKRKLYRTD